MESERYVGAVKFFRGSFGWLTCDDAAQKTGGRDIFLHKNQLNSVPTAGDEVEFRLIVDGKGQPKAERKGREQQKLTAFSLQVSRKAVQKAS